jgi:surface antigen
MEELAHRRGRTRLAIAFLVVGVALPLRVGAARAQQEEATVVPAPSGFARPAQAPQEGASRSEPIRVFTDARGRTCRVYERRVVIEGAQSTALGTICREPSGRWVLSR